MLSVRLLGQFDVAKNGSTIEVVYRPAQLLLAYLILNAGTAQRREKLAGLFWPDSSETNARNNLRQALWRVRKALEGEEPAEQNYIVADEATITFVLASEYWLDVDQLRETSNTTDSIEDLIGVVSPYEGELLPGFYDDWVNLERDRLLTVFEQKMQLLLDRLVEAHRWSEVLEWGERWIVLGQTPEPAYRSLMMAHYSMGDRSSVVSVYRRCVEALREDLGVDPSAQTQALYQRLLSEDAPTASEASEPTGLSGQAVGPFRVVEQLGTGGMAEVYKAYQPRLDRYVALKFIKSELVSQGDFQARFEREAKLMAQLNHPNIVHIYDFGEAGSYSAGQPRLYYLAMEFVAGGTLRDWLKTSSKSGHLMELDQVLIILEQVCAALDYAHQQGIIHRDIKPANIMLTPDGRALLSDFGLAKLVNRSDDLTQSGTTTGTPAYMSPEQIRGDSTAIGPLSDLYSLGVVLYELLTGQVPFSADSSMAVLLKHVKEAVPPPRTLNPDLSEAVERVLLKALAKDPEERFQQAQKLAESFSRAIASVPAQTPGQDSEPTIPQLTRWPQVPDEPAPALGSPPFKGLQHFDESDADLFFGREMLTAKLVARLASLLPERQDQTRGRFMAVVGASGSGKSSLVRAGLIPALRRSEHLAGDSLPPRVVRPGRSI